MPKVDLQELEEKAKKIREAELRTTPKVIAGKTCFPGSGSDFYDSPGEALESRQREKLLSEYKKQGLDEFGRSPEAIASAEKISALIAKREKHIDEIRKIETEIGLVKSGLDLDAIEKKRAKK